MPVLLDLNNRAFQSDWFALEKEERMAVLQTCMKLAAMEWNDIYRDKGLHWEMIQSHQAEDGSRLFTIRINRKMRATVRREGEYLEFLSLHPDHDSAYH
jgi:hypothetical protein